MYIILSKSVGVIPLLSALIGVTQVKNKNRTKIGLAAFILMLGFICGSIPVSAASSKILVTDNDGDNTISIGDEFCVGAECFYVLANENGKVKALTKYNLKVGGDTFDVAGKAEFTNVDYNTRQKNMMTNNYTECDWKNVNDLYTATVCHSSYNTTYDIIDISNDSDLVDIPSNDFWSKIYAKYNYVDSCLFDTERRQIDGKSVRYITSADICYSKNRIIETDIKQSPKAISAHGDEKGKPAFPTFGDVYLKDGYYDKDNNLLVSPSYAAKYVESNYQGKNNYYISYYLDEYNKLLSQNTNVEDINLLSFNQLVSILNDINTVGAKFEKDDYMAEDLFDWERNDVTEDSLHKYAYWSTSLKKYVPEQYSWLYSTTYWLATNWYNDASTYEDWKTNDDGNQYRTLDYNYQFFIDTLGDLCSVAGSCGDMGIGAGIRPVITMAADQFELNRMDIVGSVRWVDNNNSSKIRPNKSIIKLYRNGVMIDSVEVTKDEEEDLWRFSFKNLLKYDASGNLYKYTITQDDVAQYSSDITNFDVVNQYAPSVENPKTSAINPGIYAGVITIVGAGAYLVIRRSRR